ncbi:MAG TPA: glutamate--tRNA ligase [Clostridiales bacterium]|nr:glutamate--tRNA ligase [Clostridiales bacterium]
MGEVRTRFAPSPTGYMHIGNLRTALYAYLIAKSNDGKFILRIEDTDQDRYVEGAIDVIYNTLKIVGIEHDEGPDIGGDYGPYIQSERKEIYQKYIKELIDKGDAYYCFCSKERLENLRQESKNKKIPFRYDGHCRNLTKAEVEEKLAAGEKYVIRQKVPQTGTTTFKDEVFGKITVENSSLDDSILIKSDGMPTYNFANVVDDHLMAITHVVRGSEYLSSTPKYNLLYKAFGWEIPIYVHLPLILREDGKKLSKREGDASFEDLYRKGFLKEAIINYIALLGWSPGTEQELFTLDELIENFSIDGLSKSPAIFDMEKLRWMNGEYIRKLSLDEFKEVATPYFKKPIKKRDVDYDVLSRLLHTRTEVLSEIPEQLDFVDELPDYDIELYTHKRMKTNPENALIHLKEAYKVLEELEDWSFDSIHDSLMDLVKKLGVKNGQVLWPVRVALSGKQYTPGGAIELAELLGKEETLKRIKIGIEKLSSR